MYFYVPRGDSTTTEVPRITYFVSGPTSSPLQCAAGFPAAHRPDGMPKCFGPGVPLGRGTRYGVRSTSIVVKQLSERPQARPRPPVVAGLEVSHALVPGAVAHEGHAELDAGVDAAVAGELRSGV